MRDSRKRPVLASMKTAKVAIKECEGLRLRTEAVVLAFLFCWDGKSAIKCFKAIERENKLTVCKTTH